MTQPSVVSTEASVTAPRVAPIALRAEHTPLAVTRVRRARLWRRGLLAVFVLALLAAIGYGLAPTPVAIESAVVRRAPMQVTIEEDGVASIRDRYVVSAPMLGHLARIRWNPGDHVDAGAVVASLAPISPALLDVRSRREAQARLSMSLAAQRQAAAQAARAELSYQFAKDDSARKRSLEQAGALSHEVIEQAALLERTAAADRDSLRFAQRVADHDVELARAALARAQGPSSSDAELIDVVSPVNGKVLRVLQQSEGVVQVGTPLLEIGDPDALEIVIDVLTSDAVRIRPSNVVLLERWGGPVLEGRVRRVDPSAFTRISALGVEEQRVHVVADLVSPHAEREALSDGYRVEARVIVWEGRDVLQVPTSAVFRQQDEWAVYRVLDGTAKLTRLQLGERTGHAVQVLGGLAPDERVILHPSDRVADGVRVAAP